MQLTMSPLEYVFPARFTNIHFGFKARTIRESLTFTPAPARANENAIQMHKTSTSPPRRTTCHEGCLHSGRKHFCNKSRAFRAPTKRDENCLVGNWRYMPPLAGTSKHHQNNKWSRSRRKSNFTFDTGKFLLLLLVGDDAYTHLVSLPATIRFVSMLSLNIAGIKPQKGENDERNREEASLRILISTRCRRRRLRESHYWFAAEEAKAERGEKANHIHEKLGWVNC